MFDGAIFSRSVRILSACACALILSAAGSAGEKAKLTASDAAAADEFGRNVAISGDTAIAGSPLDDDAGAGSGSAYVFVRTGSSWSEEQKLTASDAGAGDAFGIAVHVDGDTAAVGAFFDDDGGNNAGAVYIFTRSGTTWSEQQKLTASDAAAGDQFGRSVYLSGDTVVIGADRDDDNGNDSGSAYVFTRSGTTWTEEQKLTASDGAVGDTFGRSVSVSGDSAVVGAFHDGDAGGLGIDSGSAYVFVRSGTTWSEEQKLTASDASTGDLFGEFVAISGDTVLSGATGNDDNGADSGSAYVFTRSGTTWSEQMKLLASDGAAGDEFGKSVSVDGDKAVVGARFGDDGGADSGSAYAFLRSGTSWSEFMKYTASDGAAGDVLGRWVGISGDTAIAGAAGDDDGGADSGSAYVFLFDTTPPVVTCPSNMTVECTSSNGAVVNFNATATDDRDAAPGVVCNPTSGSVFAIGTTQVDCTATDASGNSSMCSFMITVEDTTAPDVTCPNDITQECAGPTGAVVNFTVTATDTCDTNPGVVSNPASGSLFPIGTTQVTSTATDADGNSSMCTFDVTVEDTTDPTVNCPSNMVVECTAFAGTVVNFMVTASDLCDGDVTVVANPASGSLFSFGTTQVTATATDDAGNSSMCMFNVDVVDTTAPVVTCPDNISVGCTEPGGAMVEFTIDVDDCDPNVMVTAVPASGSLFPVGTTTVMVTAEDASSNMSMCMFDVTVGATVVPSDGSELGDNHINIFGCGFTTLPDTVVEFGGIAATVLSVTEEHIAVRTPAGIGTVDVTIINSNGTTTLSSAYTYIDPVIAARFGNVNVGIGAREDILLVNGSAGDAERIVDVAVDNPFSLEILVPSSRMLSRYAVWAWVGLSDLSTMEPAPLDIGTFAFPPPFADRNPRPRKTFNLLGHKPTLGCPDIPSSPAPHKFFCRPGRSRAITVSFQGLVRDDGARVDLGPQDYSVTNLVSLRTPVIRRSSPRGERKRTTRS